MMRIKQLPIMRLSGVLILSAVAAACSGSGGSGSSNNGNNDNGDASSLQLIAPKTIFSLPSASNSGYVVVNNPTGTAVKNLHYTLASQLGGGKQVEIDPVSAKECAVVPAYSDCNVKVTVPAGAVAGSIGLTADNNSSLLTQLSKALKSDSATKSVAYSGIEQAAYNTASDADGVTLSYYHTVINCTPYVLVSGLVASANA